MARLELILIFVLRFQAGAGVASVSLYYTPGRDAVLPCDGAWSPDTACSSVLWLYRRERSRAMAEVENGNVVQSSARAARLGLDANCSLVIGSITAEDAGLYTCRRRDTRFLGRSMYLHILTISAYLPEADPKRDGDVLLKCFLLRYSELLPCAENSIRWVDEKGTVLPDKGVGYELTGQKNCASLLTLRCRSCHNRRYTCQFVDADCMKIEAHYTPVSTGGTSNNSQTKQPESGWSPLRYVMLSLRYTGLFLLTVVVFLLLRDRGIMTPCADNIVNNDDDEVKYENAEAFPAAGRLH